MLMEEELEEADTRNYGGMCSREVRKHVMQNYLENLSNKKVINRTYELRELY